MMATVRTDRSLMASMTPRMTSLRAVIHCPGSAEASALSLRSLSAHSLTDSTGGGRRNLALALACAALALVIWIVGESSVSGVTQLLQRLKHRAPQQLALALDPSRRLQQGSHLVR